MLPIMHLVFIMTYDGTTELCFDSKIIDAETIRKKSFAVAMPFGKCYKCILYNSEDISSDQMHFVLCIDSKSNIFGLFFFLFVVKVIWQMLSHAKRLADSSNDWPILVQKHK